MQIFKRAERNRACLINVFYYFRGDYEKSRNEKNRKKMS